MAYHCITWQAISARPYLTRLNPLERQFVRLIVPFVKVGRVFHSTDGQYVSTGNATHFYNKAGTVVTRLPRCREDTQYVFVRCTRDIGSDALTGSVVRVRPELVRDTLCSLMSTSSIYAGVEFDEDAMHSLEEVDVMNDGGGGSDDEADNDDDDDSEDDNGDESAEHTAEPRSTAPSSSNIVDETLSDDTADADPALGGATADAADVFVDIDDDARGLAADLDELLDSDVQPRFDLEDAVNMVEQDADIICSMFPQHFMDGVGSPKNSVLQLTEFFRHAMLWHDQRFAKDVEFLFFVYKYQIKRRLFSLCVRATRDEPHITAADLENARRAAATADAPEGTVGAVHPNTLEDAAALEQGNRVLKRLSVFSNAMQGTVLHIAKERASLLAAIASGSSKFDIFFTMVGRCISLTVCS